MGIKNILYFKAESRTHSFITSIPALFRLRTTQSQNDPDSVLDVDKIAGSANISGHNVDIPHSKSVEKKPDHATSSSDNCTQEELPSLLPSIKSSEDVMNKRFLYNDRIALKKQFGNIDKACCKYLNSSAGAHVRVAMQALMADDQLLDLKCGELMDQVESLAKLLRSYKNHEQETKNEWNGFWSNFYSLIMDSTAVANQLLNEFTYNSENNTNVSAILLSLALDSAFTATGANPSGIMGVISKAALLAQVGYLSVRCYNNLEPLNIFSETMPANVSKILDNTVKKWSKNIESVERTEVKKQTMAQASTEKNTAAATKKRKNIETQSSELSKSTADKRVRGAIASEITATNKHIIQQLQNIQG